MRDDLPAAEARRIPWFMVARDPRTPEEVALRYAAMAQAHLEAYQPWLAGAGPGARAAVRDATRRYLCPFMAAFTAAALAKGWTTERVHEALVDGQTAAEFAWQWCSEGGVDPLTLLPADAID